MEFLRLFPTNIAVTQVLDYEHVNQELDKLDCFNGEHHFSKRRDLWELRTQYQVVQQLYDQMMTAVVEYANNYHSDQTYDSSMFTFSEGWTNETARGENLFIHNHKLTHLTCVYYRSITEDSGAIDFIDPRGSLGFISLDKITSFNIFRMQPKTGDLLIFPGWVLHYVHPNNTDMPRKIVGANIKLNDDAKIMTPGILKRKPGTSIMKLG